MPASNVAVVNQVPSGAVCSKKWFPPKNFQLRLRSIRKIAFRASPPPAASEEIFIELSHTYSGEPFWSGKAVLLSNTEDFFVWSDISLGGRDAGSPGCVFKIKKRCFSSSSILIAHGAFLLNQLCCIGVHFPPPQCIEAQQSLLVQAAGSYFVTPSSTAAANECISPRLPPTDIIPIKPATGLGPLHQNHQVLKSYDANLLTRLLRLHRTLVQQASTNGHNRDTISYKVLGPSKEVIAEQKAKKAASSFLRQRHLLNRTKEAATRARENQLKAEIETLKLRVDLLQDECSRVQNNLGITQSDLATLRCDTDLRSTSLTSRMHELARTRTDLNEWRDERMEYEKAVKYLVHAHRAAELQLIAQLDKIYPINPKDNTIRYVKLPSLEKARQSSNDEQELAVSLGWVCHLVSTIANILDVPLRYPLNFAGSASTVTDPGRVNHQDGGDFSLFLPRRGTSAELARTDYAIFILNKNVAQVRWHCGLITSDLKMTLNNLAELLALGDNSQGSENYIAGGKGKSMLWDPPPQKAVQLLSRGAKHQSGISFEPPPPERSTHAAKELSQMLDDEEDVEKDNEDGREIVEEVAKDPLFASHSQIHEHQQPELAEEAKETDLLLPSVSFVATPVNGAGGSNTDSLASRANALSLGAKSFQRYSRPKKA